MYQHKGNIQMKKIAVVALALGSFLGSSAVLADNHTISLGYAQSRVQHFGNIRGGDIQYRYEWDSPFSVIGSFTYMKGNESEFNSYDNTDNPPVKVKDHTKIDIKYYSLLAGPAYRINDYISPYGLVGVAHANAKSAYDESIGDNTPSTEKNSFNATSFAYAAGIATNPIENLAINVGYEGTNVRIDGDNSNINGFNVGIGYRF